MCQENIKWISKLPQVLLIMCNSSCGNESSLKGVGVSKSSTILPPPCNKVKLQTKFYHSHRHLLSKHPLVRRPRTVHGTSYESSWISDSDIFGWANYIEDLFKALTITFQRQDSVRPIVIISHTEISPTQWLDKGLLREES